MPYLRLARRLSPYLHDGFYIECASSTTAHFKEKNMPIIAWLLGVPISVILLLMLFGVF